MSTKPISLEFPPELIEAIAEKVAERLTPAGPEKWVGVAEVAAHMGCKPPRIYELTSRKDGSRLPHHRDGTRLLFRLSEIDSYLGGHR